jgi:hypothetical protein
MSADYLRNASVNKDEGGDYWLHIYSGEGHAVFCLNDCLDLNAAENAGVRETLEAWTADQDSGNGQKK